MKKRVDPMTGTGTMKLLAMMTVALALGLGGCRAGIEKENEDLKGRVAELTTKISTLEADNARLKEQIAKLTAVTDGLTDVLKSQQALGTVPTATPAASPH
jgi:hypothetical protein